MRIKSRLYNTIIKVLSQHKKWLDVRHKFTLAWIECWQTRCSMGRIEGQMMMILSVMVILPVLVMGVEPDHQAFTVVNQSDLPLQTVARVSLPVPLRVLTDEALIRVSLAGKTTASQARVITKHPDGSIRRLMLSLPVELGPGETVRGVCELQNNAMPVSSIRSMIMV